MPEALRQLIDDDVGYRTRLRLTDDGKRLARQRTMSDDPDAVLDALLEAQSET